MKRIFIPGFGYQLIETKNPFRRKKVIQSIITKGLFFYNKPSIETDMC
jgi:hypothetical protein